MRPLTNYLQSYSDQKRQKTQQKEEFRYLISQAKNL